MTKKDYERLAAAFGRAYHAVQGTNPDHTRLRTYGVTEALVEVAMELEAENPRFDRNRFVEAAQASIGSARANPTASERQLRTVDL
jgi:serine/threonine protein kinase HipA of HipAB toxin-antitoxin module